MRSGGSDAMPRFVILEHDWPEVHWDLLLEAGEALRAWRLLEEPRPGRTVSAEPNFDHRLVYLEYEGPLTGDRGNVKRWDSGAFEWVHNEPESVVIELDGRRLAGRVMVHAGHATFPA